MTPLLFGLDDNVLLHEQLCHQLKAEPGRLERRRFPDGETYLRVLSACAGRPALIVCGLDRPDEKVVPLLLLCDLLRQLGASQVGLVAPYLAYMRQDMAFNPGEGVNAAVFARLLSGYVDWLVTVDPHLHRIARLDEVYRVPALALSAVPLLAQWIAREVVRPVLIGPDAESAQWVEAVAALADLPSVVLTKVRHGDREVEVSVPQVEKWSDHTPVLVDDIVSTGHTILEAVQHLHQQGLKPPVCVAVHGILAEAAEERLHAAGIARLVTTNAIPHTSNAIDLSELLASGIRQMVEGRY